MIYKEALAAMKSREQVKCNGILYKHINAIIFRKTDDIEMIQVELQDASNYNSVTIAKIENVERVERRGEELSE